jgi:hypothetical protein
MNTASISENFSHRYQHSVRHRCISPHINNGDLLRILKGNEPACEYIYMYKRSAKIHNIPTYSFGMAPPISTSSSSDGHHEGFEASDEASPAASPRVCRCENQLGHWDWAGRPLPDLPEWCRLAIRNRVPTHIAVNEGKI